MRIRTIVLFIVLLGALAACGDTAPSLVLLQPTAIYTSAAFATLTPARSSETPLVTALPPTPPLTTASALSGTETNAALAPVTTVAPSPLASPTATEAALTVTPTVLSDGTATPHPDGSELLGQMAAYGDLDIRVQKADIFDSLIGNWHKVTSPKGAFLVVTFDVANVGTKPSTLGTITIIDSKHREFTYTHDVDAVGALSENKMLRVGATEINPGFLTTAVMLYDVAPDATGLKVQVDSQYRVPRTPSSESFLHEGGTGKDSGAGQELVGQTFADTRDNLLITVTKVDRVTSIGNAVINVLTPGVYMIVTYRVKNDGPVSYFQNFDVKDNQGGQYTTTDFHAASALKLDKTYHLDDTIETGHTGTNVRIFSVRRDARGFTLVSTF